MGISDDMLRKGAAALILLAVLLIGVKPMADLAVAAGAGLEHCCDDCDQPAMPDGTDCGKAGRCIAAPSSPLFTPPLVSLFAFFDSDSSSPPLTSARTASADRAPLFRPPRPFLIA